MATNRLGLYHLKIYLFFCLYYHTYWYFFEKGVDNLAKAPLFFPILKDFVWLIFICMAFVYILMCGKKGVRTHKVDRYYDGRVLFILAFFLLYVCVALLHFLHKNPLDVLQHNIRNLIWYSPIIFVLPYLVKDNYEIKSIFRFLLVNGIVICVIGITTKFLNREFLLWGGDRVLSTLGNPNNLAFFLSILFFIILLRILITRKIKTSSLLLLGIFLICILMTISVSYVLSLPVGVLLAFVVSRRLKPSMGLIFLGSLTILVLFKVGFFSELVHKYNRMMAKDSTSTSYYGRIEQLQEMRKFITDADLVDIVFGDFGLERYRRYDGQYFNFLRNDGLLLLLYFLLMFIYVVYVGIRKAKRFIEQKEYDLAGILMGCSVALLTILIVNLNVTAYLNRFPLNFLVYLLIGIIILVNSSQTQLIGTKINEKGVR